MKPGLKILAVMSVVGAVLLLADCRKKPVAALIPNRAPVATCQADKSSVYLGSGDTVDVKVQASDPDGDSLSYRWGATGGAVQGNGPAAKWSAGNAAAGTYTVSATVDDGKGLTGTCAVDIRVEPRPNRAPSLTCSAQRSSVLAGERVRITGLGNDPDGDTLTYSWRTSGGSIVGSGASVQLDTGGLAPGRYTVTGRVEDGRGGAADCSAGVTVEAPPPPPQAAKLNEVYFRPSSARVDNVGKRVLDDIALRLKSDPDAKVVLVGYSDPKEPKRLALERAEQTKKYLVAQGVAETRIDARSATGQAGAGRQNQRVDIIWLPKGATF